MATSIQKSLKREIAASQKSVFSYPGYHDAENMWVKILDMKSPHKNGQRQNIRVNERAVRCKNCFYAPFEQTD